MTNFDLLVITIGFEFLMYVPYLCSKWQKHEFCDRSELKDFYLGHRWLSRATFLEPRILISHGAENPAL